MNVEKLKRLQQQVRIGGKGTPRRKKKIMHQTAATDDKKLQSSLKKLSVSTIPGIEEVNIIKDDLTVIHFNNPKTQASLSANTFAVTGHGEAKKVVEMLPELLPQLGQETVSQLRMFANSMSNNQKQQMNSGIGGVVAATGTSFDSANAIPEGDEDEDDVPMLVEDFDQVAKIEAATSKQKVAVVAIGETKDKAPGNEQPQIEEKSFIKTAETAKSKSAESARKSQVAEQKKKDLQQVTQPQNDTPKKISKEKEKMKAQPSQQQQNNENKKDAKPLAKEKEKPSTSIENQKQKAEKPSQTLVKKDKPNASVPGAKPSAEKLVKKNIPETEKINIEIKEQTKAPASAQQDGKPLAPEVVEINKKQKQQQKSKQQQEKSIIKQQHQQNKQSPEEANKLKANKSTSANLKDDSKTKATDQKAVVVAGATKAKETPVPESKQSKDIVEEKKVPKSSQKSPEPAKLEKTSNKTELSPSQDDLKNVDSNAADNKKFHLQKEDKPKSGETLSNVTIEEILSAATTSNKDINEEEKIKMQENNTKSTEKPNLKQQKASSSPPKQIQMPIKKSPPPPQGNKQTQQQQQKQHLQTQQKQQQPQVNVATQQQVGSKQQQTMSKSPSKQPSGSPIKKDVELKKEDAAAPKLKPAVAVVGAGATKGQSQLQIQQQQQSANNAKGQKPAVPSNKPVTSNQPTKQTTPKSATPSAMSSKPTTPTTTTSPKSGSPPTPIQTKKGSTPTAKPESAEVNTETKLSTSPKQQKVGVGTAPVGQVQQHGTKTNKSQKKSSSPPVSTVNPQPPISLDAVLMPITATPLEPQPVAASATTQNSCLPLFDLVVATASTTEVVVPTLNSIAATPSPVSAAPTPATPPAPTPVSSTPIPATPAPTPVSSTPIPATPAPTPTSATPTPATPAPTPTSATPTPSTPAPTPASATSPPATPPSTPVSSTPILMTPTPTPAAAPPSSMPVAVTPNIPVTGVTNPTSASAQPETPLFPTDTAPPPVTQTPLTLLTVSPNVLVNNEPGPSSDLN